MRPDLPSPRLSPCRPLERRTPGETDIRIFTTEVLPAGRHRVDRSRPRLRVFRDARGAGRVRLAVLTPEAVRGAQQ